MRLTEQVKDMRDEAKLRRLDARLDRADRDRDRLRSENDLLRERVEAADEERRKWLSTIEGLMEPRSGSKHRVRRVLVLATAAGGAYVLGARAGRGRYEQIRARWDEIRGRATNGEGARVTEMSGGEDLVAEGSTTRAVRA